MKRTLLITIVLAAVFCLSGCVVATYEEHRHARHPHVFRCPPGPVVEVIHVPGPPPGPPWYRPGPRPW